MSKAEVEKLTDEELLSEWEQIKTAYRSSLPQYLSPMQNNILFANFINVSSELSKRGLDTTIKEN